MISEGTWKVGKQDGVVVTSVTRPGFAGRDDKDSVDYYGGFLICESCHPEDAALISASKDLLASLKAIMKHAEIIINMNHPDMKDAVAAIKKAEGR